jgi:hypothetical protein
MESDGESPPSLDDNPTRPPASPLESAGREFRGGGIRRLPRRFPTAPAARIGDAGRSVRRRL